MTSKIRFFVLVIPFIAIMLALSTQWTRVAGQTNGLLGWWKFDETSGTTASDSSGSGNNGTLGGAPTWVSGKINGALSFGGSADSVNINKSLVSTTGSYSVAAWVKLNNLNGWQTAVSQDWATISGFYLQYGAALGNKFGFSLQSSDSVSSTSTRALSNASPVAGAWYHIVGVRDSTNNQIKLYVNGSLNASQAYSAPWSAAGNTVIGRGKWNGGSVDWFNGAMDDVRIYNRVLSDSEVSGLYNAGTQSGLASYWKFDEASGTTAADSSGSNNTATLLGSAAFTVSGRINGGLNLNGSTAYVDANKNLVDTTASYSVAAWVLLNNTNGYETAVSQDGANVSGFFLQHVPGSGFAFSITNGDSGTSATTRVIEGAEPSTGRWYHLVGVRDGGANQMRLYMDGSLVSTQTLPTVWSATGHTVIGRGKWNGGNVDWWPGRIDDVHVYTRVLSASEITSVYSSAPPLAWQKGVPPLQTQWYAAVSPTNALPDYPRPQMVRSAWQNLNGLWQFTTASAGQAPPYGQTLPEQVLVPYPIESALSGVMRHEDRMWYRTTFTVPSGWSGQHVLLNFGAVDWQSTIYLNGQQIGTHTGGYDGFSLDITNNLVAGSNELIVNVYAPVDSGGQPRGKQVKSPGGIFYTASSGIWETVWLEPVGATHISDLKIVPDIDAGLLRLTVSAAGGTSGYTINAVASSGGTTVANVNGTVGSEIDLPIASAHLWSPDDPFLYDLQVTLKNGSTTADATTSYFGMRKISLGVVAGANRMLLNNKFVFEMGPLDQGFWPEGGYTAPTDDALKFDLQQEKAFGWNMVRKHIKVEPDRWYYWADKLGLLVWQDMPSGDSNNNIAGPAGDFQAELTAMINGRRSHPSIVLWIVFNESWGQNQFGSSGTTTFTNLVKSLDPSRLVTNATGWNDYNVGDIIDSHCYVGPCAPTPTSSRASVNGEFGGLGLEEAGHDWPGGSFAYEWESDSNALTNRYVGLINSSSPNATSLMNSPGLSAAVYTEVTDVEQEHNGFMTYDRAIIKVNVAAVNTANTNLINASKALNPGGAAVRAIMPAGILLGNTPAAPIATTVSASKPVTPATPPPSFDG